MKYFIRVILAFGLILHMEGPINAQFSLDKKTSLKLAPAATGVSMTMYLLSQTDLEWRNFNKRGCMSAIGQVYTLMMTARCLAPAIIGCVVSGLLFCKKR